MILEKSIISWRNGRLAKTVDNPSYSVWIPPPPFPFGRKLRRVCLWNTNAPGSNKAQIGYSYYKSQGHKFIDISVIWKGFISWVCMPDLYALSLNLLRIKSCGQGYFMLSTHRQTGHKLDAP